MTVLTATTQDSGSARLVSIGRIELPGAIVPYPKNFRDVEADTEWAQTVLESMGIRDDALSLFISGGAESVQIWPYQNAAMRLGSPQTFAENSPFDAYRVEMFLRRFQLQLVFGLTGNIVQGLRDGGHDLGRVFGSAKQVVAFADAWRHLRQENVDAWRLVSLGATYAIEAPEGGGARYDQSEWFVEEDKGELLLTSLSNRAMPIVRMRTGVEGSIVLHPNGRRILVKD